MAFDVGGTNFAKSMHYLRETGEQRVFLARRSLLRPFNQANKKLFEKSIYPFPVDDAVRIGIKREGIEKAIWRLKTKAGGRKQWGVSPEEETADPDMQTVATLLKNLKVIKYLSDEKPPDSAPALEILLLREEDSALPAWLKLFPVESDRAVAISSHTEIPVILATSQVNRLLGKSKKILSGN